jgi:hypothetical protein
MKRFKFRAWDKITKTWIHINNINDYINNKDIIIQQCVGVSDSKQIDIFEGDIIDWNIDIKNNKTTSIVKWGEFGFILFDIFRLKSIPFVYMDTMTVIGNIFEPPCNPDHNGECLVCDNFVQDCIFKQ